MDVSSAAFVLDVITAGAAAVWLLGAWFVLATRRALAAPRTGEMRIQAPASVVLERVMQVLALSSEKRLLAGATIESATGCEVRWRGPAVRRHVGRLTVADDGGSAHVRWEIGNPRVMQGAVVLIACGAVVIVALHVVLRVFVLTSEDPNVRGQVWQMTQVVHLLWPPFLLAGGARLLRALVVFDLRRVLRDTPFTPSAAAAGRG